MKKFFSVLMCGYFALAVLGLRGQESTSTLSSWADKVSIKGDFRLRGDSIDEDGKDTRNRGRFRARLSLKGEVNEEIDAHMRLSSGSDDPVSTNQSFDEGFSTKDFGLDRAYVDYHPAGLGINFLGGKMANPFEVVDNLVWDGDLNPEGIAVKYSADTDLATFFANGALFYVDERKSDSDAYMYGGQLGAEVEPMENVTWTSGVAYYLYDNMAGFEPLWDAEDSFGNSVIEQTDDDGNTTLLYKEDFGELELFTIVDFNVGLPVSVYADYVLNTEASDNDTAYMLGLTLNKAKDPGSWELDYNWRDLEADSVVGLFTDSDSFGGGTNAQGHRIQAKYQLQKNWQIGSTLFLDKLDPDGKDTDFTRFFLDLVFQF